VARTRPALAPRKRHIVGLVAQGMTNKQIAHHLAISVRTVDAHLEQIRNHLGVLGRVLLAAWASSEPAPTGRPG
jgi:DNA-binding NarL/FixJ family response regulator